MMATRRGLRPPMLEPAVVALSIVFLAALALRLYGINWDQGADLHPDELFVAKIVLIDRIHLDWPPDGRQLFDPARSGLNPRSADPATGEYREFAYGALPLWITDASAWALSRLTETDWNSADRAYLVGRAISATLSALTVLPISALGTALGGRSVGLLAAFFAALAPMSIQLAHFFTTDSWLTFFVSVCLLACVIAAREGGLPRFAIAGATFGLAMATKGSVFALAAPIAVALAVDAVRRFDSAKPAAALRAALVNSAAAALAAGVAFLLFEPFALLRPTVFLQSLRTQADIAAGVFDVPFTRVYAGTFPLGYQLEQLLRWGYGPVAGALALAGIGVIAVLAVRRRLPAALVVLGWIVAYGIVIVLSDVKFLRYLEPLAPVFAVGAALALSKLDATLRPALPRFPQQFVPLLALILTVAWTGAFLSIYAHENPRLSASRWMYGSIPPGSNLTAEYWDDALPRSLAYSFSPSAFGLGTIVVDLYQDLAPVKASDAIYKAIKRADYIVQSSQRVAAAVRAAPWRYPVQGRYFDQLERGAFGFERAASFARSPAIGNVQIDDRRADESFVNYDHPRVAIYKQTRPIARAEFDTLMFWALQRPWYPSREPPEPTLLLDGPVAENPSVDDARWSAAATSTTGAAMAVWIGLLIALLAAGLPIARFVLPLFPDRGWGLARTLALVVAAYPIWLGSSLKLFRFRAVWVVLAILAVAVIGWWLRVRGGKSFAHPRRALRGRAWMHPEAAFWLVFLVFFAFRLANPDSWHPFWGGEKPMEFAQINAIGRSAFFPPFDPWYADGYVNYYYYGFYLAAFLFKATGIPAEVGFNLALPTVMGMLASGGFSVSAALARGLTRSARLTVLGGWIGVVALCVMGNLSAVRGLLGGGSARFDPFLYWTWSGSRAIDNAITEFPFFSGLYADLHSHVIALPLTVATIAICLATATSQIPAERSTTFRRAPSLKPVVARLTLLALLLGTLSATNAWDVPVYAALAIASILIATANVMPMSRRILTFGAGSLLTVAGGWLLFLPFHLQFVPLFGQLAPVRDPTDPRQFITHLGGLIVLSSVGLTVLLLPRSRYVASWIAFPAVWLVTGALGVFALTTDSETLRIAGSLLLLLALAGPPLIAAWRLPNGGSVPGPVLAGRFRGILVVAAVVAGAGLLSDRVVFALLLALAGAAAVGWMRLESRAERFVCLMLAAGCFTAAGAEIVVVADDLIGTAAYRMNTVFKFYNQVWVLLGLAGSALAALMVREALRKHASHRFVPPIASQRHVWSRSGVALSVVLSLAALTYPVLATRPRLAQRFTPGTEAGSLDALGWMASGTVPVVGDPTHAEIAFAGDADAIDWFFANVKGTPVIAEASIGPYRCNGSRISAATGLPTIIGWERHEQQQRYPKTLPARVGDVRTLYTSSDLEEKASILRRYNVEYVVVGDLERLYPIANNECTPSGSAAGIAAFASMLGTTLEVAHSAAGTTIYRVLPAGAA